jgi:diaminopimelate decarboxylase
LSQQLFPTLPEIGVSGDGVLQLAGRSAQDLVEQYGSPLVIILEEAVRRNCSEYRSRFDRYPRSRVYYASKAFLSRGFCRLIEQEQLCLDVVSAGELRTALDAGFPPDRIGMHGNAKSRAELELALASGVGRIIIDNYDEIDLLAELARTASEPVKVHLRVTPGIQPSTHQYVQTGQVDSKFGFNLAGGMAEAAARRILDCNQLSLLGIHCHIGSQIFDGQTFLAAARVMLEFYVHLQRNLNAPLDELNLGGGLAIRYQPEDRVDPISSHLAELCDYVLESCQSAGITPPVLCDEPGRSIVGEAGVTLYTVQSTKVIPGVRSYASVDGGMTDNPRFALYSARHSFALANRMHESHGELWSVSGKCCESGDMLIKDVMLPNVQRGDLIAAFGTGAYTYSMASNYNRVAKPAVLLLGSGREGLLARREEAEDLSRLDLVPDWLT